MATTEGDVPDGNDLPVNVAGGDGGEKKSCDESKPSCPARSDVKMFGNNTTVDDKAAVKFEDGSQEDKDSTHNAGQDVELTRDIPSLHDEAGGCGEEKTCATQPAGQDVEVIRDDSSAIDGAYVGKEKSREDSHKSCNADQAVKKKDASMKTSNAKKKDTKKSKDGWVCPDTGCRKRNSSEDATCTKCGLIQSFRAEARYSRKARVSGLVVTHVCSPVSLYVQTPQQQRDYARVRSRMAEMYANAAYRPSRIVPNMVLGMKCDGGYERVRTVRTVPGVKATLDHGTATVNLTAEGIDKEAPKAAPSSPGGGTSLKWRVQLMDRGSWCEALEDDFNFLLSGLSDLKPLAAMFSLNELRVARGATEAQIEESRAWLEQELSSGVIEGDVYKQTRNQWSPPSLDLFKDGTLINKALLRFAAVESTAKSKILKADVVGAHAPSAADEGTSLQPSESAPSSEVPMLNMALRLCSYCHQEGHYKPSCGKFIADCNDDPRMSAADEGTSQQQCSYCHQKGHHKESCSKFIADCNEDPRMSAADEGTSGRQCSYCHQEGHYKPACGKFIADCNDDPRMSAADEGTSQQQCSYCHQKGHHKESCSKFIADCNEDPRMSAADEGTSGRQCSYCHQEGHYEPSCRKFIADCNEDPTILFATDE